MKPRDQALTTSAQLGTLVRLRRKARGLSQAEIASKLGISQGRLSTLEADPGSLPLDRLIALTRLLGFELVLRDRDAARPPETEW